MRVGPHTGGKGNREQEALEGLQMGKVADRRERLYLVQLQADSALHELLCLIDGGLQGNPLWAEPEAVVYQLCVPVPPSSHVQLHVSFSCLTT